MTQPPQSARVFRFGVFEADLRSRELRKSGLKVKLWNQPFRLLAVLLARPGEVVTYEELRKELWPDGTFVEFEHSLHKDISKVREALGDSPGAPRFIETVPRRGYRFIEPVEEVGEGRRKPQDVKPRIRLWTACLLLLLAAGGVASLRFLRPAAERPGTEPKIIPLTTYPGLERTPSFSPDGNHVAFTWDGESQDNNDIYVKVLDAGQPLRLTTDAASDFGPAWSPDGHRIAFYRQSLAGTEIYSLSSLGGSERRLAGLTFDPGLWGPLSWSPDGKTLAFADRESAGRPYRIFLLSIESGEKRRLPLRGPELPSCFFPTFSPDGRTLAFVGGTTLGDLYVARVSDGEYRRLTFDKAWIAGLAWTPDGRGIVFSSERAGGRSLWTVPSSGGTPRRVADTGEDAISPAVSRQERLVFVRLIMDTNIWQFDVSVPASGRVRATRLIASTRWDDAPQFSPDGKQIAFCSNRSGEDELWLANGDGSNPVQLTPGSWPVWSPDGKQIAYDSKARGDWNIYVIRVEGGAARLMTTDPGSDARPSWSPDGRWIYFSSDRSGTFQIWKLPAEGGDPVQVTKSGGWTPSVSPDGRFVYYAKAVALPGLWRVPAGGGEETVVLEDFQRAWLGNWAVVENGIYFAEWRESEKFGILGRGEGFIKFFDFRTRRTAVIAPLSEPIPASLLSISPDGRHLLMSKYDQKGCDLIMVDNFR